MNNSGMTSFLLLSVNNSFILIPLSLRTPYSPTNQTVILPKSYWRWWKMERWSCIVFVACFLLVLDPVIHLHTQIAEHQIRTCALHQLFRIQCYIFQFSVVYSNVSWLSVIHYFEILQDVSFEQQFLEASVTGHSS